MLVLFKYQTVENPKTGMSIRPASISTEPDQANKTELVPDANVHPFLQIRNIDISETFAYLFWIWYVILLQN